LRRNEIAMELRLSDHSFMDQSVREVNLATALRWSF